MPIFVYEGIIGKYALEEKNGALTHLYFEQEIPKIAEHKETPLIKKAKQQLDAYFEGKLTEFSLPLNPEGTEFMNTVWTLLQKIPYGKTATYGQIAAQATNPKASRAVGLANNRNPLPIFIPCHRVIGAKGSLTGFRGGLGMKQTLLNLELKEKSLFS